MTYMPNIIFSCQTTLKKAKFLEFGLKNANLATLAGRRTLRSAFMNVATAGISFGNYMGSKKGPQVGKFEWKNQWTTQKSSLH